MIIRTTRAAAVLLTWCFLAAVALAQLDVSVSTATALTGVKSPRIVGDLVLIDPASIVSTANVGIIDVKTEAAIVEVNVEDSQRNQIATQKLDDAWLIAEQGKFWITVTAVDFDKKIYSHKQIVVTIGEAPPPPTPPEPQPPNPSDAAINAPGLHVLMIAESGDTQTPPGKLAVLNSAKIRQWCNENCAKDNASVGFRLYDPDQPASLDYQHWQDAMKLPRTELPWLIISNPGVGGYQGPLPDSVDETLQLLEKYK